MIIGVNKVNKLVFKGHTYCPDGERLLRLKSKQKESSKKVFFFFAWSAINFVKLVQEADDRLRSFGRFFYSQGKERINV